jgi:putative membrane protein
MAGGPLGASVEADRPPKQYALSSWIDLRIGRRCEAMMMGGWLFMVLLPIVVVALVVGGGSAAGRAFWARGDQADKERSALQILEERFASGEIDREEFERRREILARR